MPSFPSTSLQSPETMTSSTGTLLRLSAGEIQVILNLPGIFSLSFDVMRHSSYSSSSSSSCFTPKWNHEGMTSKGGMLWKVADEMKEWHDKHFGAMHCTFSSLHLGFYVQISFSRYLFSPTVFIYLSLFVSSWQAHISRCHGHAMLSTFSLFML